MERTASQPYKIAVFSSGKSRGSNLLAMHNCFIEHRLPVSISLAVFGRGDSLAYALAKDLGLNAVVVSPRDMQVFEAQTLALCSEYSIELIALAGFMKQLSADFIAAVQVPILNIHPALLPWFGGKGMFGMAVHEAVWQAGESVSGASIHLVDPLYDHGKILAQQQVDISLCQNPAEIAARVLIAEHELYAPTIYNYLSSLGCQSPD